MSLLPHQKEAKNFVLALSDAMEAHIRIRYNVPQFTLARRNISFKVGRVRSWGGVFINRRRGPNYGVRRAGYSLALSRFDCAIRQNLAAGFNEYKHMAASPVIGTLRGVHWKKAVAALVAHEIAHALQWSYADVVMMSGEYSDFRAMQLTRGRDNKSHGKLFQFIYRDLREKFVNNDYCTNCVKYSSVVGSSRKARKAVSSSVKRSTATKRYDKGSYVIVCNMERYEYNDKKIDLFQFRWQDKYDGMRTMKTLNQLVHADGREATVENKWAAKRLIASFFGIEKV